MEKNRINSSNNFDLVRLLAASQVLITHAAEQLHIPDGPILTALRYFPGVPIFFFVSGFLISASWVRHPVLGGYTRNRILRIFPALWVAFAVSFLAIALLTPQTLLGHPGHATLWAVTQVTVLQDWNPDFLRGYGMGVVNGSLWTIPVELSFYCAVPLLCGLAKGRRLPFILVAMLLASFVALYIINRMPESVVQKALLLTPMPWIGMFLMGWLAQRYRDTLYPYIHGNALWYLLLYAAVSMVASQVRIYPLIGHPYNMVPVINYLALCGLIFSFAYTGESWADRLLHRNDISYGLYIYHMPVVNALLVLGWTGVAAAQVTVAVTVLLSLLSWFLVEKPALAKRSKPLYVHSEGTAGS